MHGIKNIVEKWSVCRCCENYFLEKSKCLEELNNVKWIFFSWQLFQQNCCYNHHRPSSPIIYFPIISVLCYHWGEEFRSVFRILSNIKVVNYFRKKLHHKCLIRFWIRLWGRYSRLRKFENCLEICLIFVKAHTRRGPYFRDFTVFVLTALNQIELRCNVALELFEAIPLVLRLNWKY